ncbi:hypothetical protein ABD91_20475 [Lysinibacillus sphaericus]|uniref:hypothetical protein n=1 Tax=Lysinibacillus sphaericus TaxID=1421 RepID=UPI0018CDFD24|nr:hypothetical protein [Lysinibacillus sphaericus]MBG9693122.1 hypothetical protein [Lysinibacillus sphaericus]
MLAQRLVENHLKHELQKEVIKNELVTEKKISEQSSDAQAFIKAKAYGLICTWVLNAERSIDDIRSHLETDVAAKAFIEKYNLYFDSVTYFNRYHVISSLAKGVYLADVNDVSNFIETL